MKASISKTRAKKALTELRAAVSQLDNIRPSEAMSTEEFVDLCEVRNALYDIKDKLYKIVKGGEG